MALLGIVGGAMAGGGAGGVHFGGQVAEYGMRSLLQTEAAEIQAKRDAVLHELRKGELKYADELRRAPGKEAQGIIDRSRSEKVVDDSGMAFEGRARTPSEMAKVEEDAYRQVGEPGLALQARGIEQQRVRDEQSGLRDQEAARRDERQHTERMTALNRQAEQQKAQIDLERRKVVVLEQAGALDLKQKEAIDKAREDYVKATDPEERQKAGATYLTLLGKVGERYKEIYETDVDGTKRTVGFFDTLSGKEIRRGPQAQPTAEDIAGLKARAKDPRAVAFFESRFGQGSAARFLEAPPPPAPPAPPAPQANPKRDQELRLRTNFGTLTSEADLKRAIELGNPHAKAWLEIKKRREADAGRSSTGELITP